MVKYNVSVRNEMSKTNEVMPLSIRSQNGEVTESSFKKESSTSKVQVQVDHHDAVKQTVMSFHDINYAVNIKKSPCGTCRPKDKKTILTHVR